MLAADLSRAPRCRRWRRPRSRGGSPVDRLRARRLHGRRVEDVPSGAGSAPAAPSPSRRRSSRRRTRPRRRSRASARSSARRSAACCSRRRASAGSSSPTRCTLVWSAFFVVQLTARATRAAPGGGARARFARPSRVSACSAAQPRRPLIVFLYFCQTIVAGAMRVLLVVTALDLLDIGNSGLGFLNAAMGVGGMIGVAVAFALVGRRRLAKDFGARADPDRRRARPDRRLADDLGAIVLSASSGSATRSSTSRASRCCSAPCGTRCSAGCSARSRASSCSARSRRPARAAAARPHRDPRDADRRGRVACRPRRCSSGARLRAIDQRAHVPPSASSCCARTRSSRRLPPATVEHLAMKLVPRDGRRRRRRSSARATTATSSTSSRTAAARSRSTARRSPTPGPARRSARSRCCRTSRARRRSRPSRTRSCSPSSATSSSPR